MYYNKYFADSVFFFKISTAVTVSFLAKDFIWFTDLDSVDLLTGVDGENAEVTVILNNIEIDFSNLTDNPVSVEADNSLGLIFQSSRDNLSDSNTFATSDGVEVTLDTNAIILKFEPFLCKQVGKYTFRYSALETTTQVDITGQYVRHSL